MQGKVTIFPSRKLISVGTRSIEDAESDLQETADTLHNSGLIGQVIVKANVRNIVAVIMTKPLALEEVALEGLQWHLASNDGKGRCLLIYLH